MGNYLGDYFVSSFQKVGTFQLSAGEKQGGNVGSYFTTANGRVLHAIAGPVDADAFLREARWVVEMCKLAQLEKQTAPAQLQVFFRKAHVDRLRQEHQLPKNALPFSHTGPRPSFALLDYMSKKGLRTQLDTQGKVHWLLAMYPLPRIQDIYRLVFEMILNEKLSTVPVKDG